MQFSKSLSFPQNPLERVVEYFHPFHSIPSSSIVISFIFSFASPRDLLLECINSYRELTVNQLLVLPSIRPMANLIFSFSSLSPFIIIPCISKLISPYRVLGHDQIYSKGPPEAIRRECVVVSDQRNALMQGLTNMTSRYEQR